MSKKLTTQEFIEKSVAVHGNKYIYDDVDYKNSKLKVKIICKEHGMFEQKPNSHLAGTGCSLCGTNRTKNILSTGLNKFVEKANKKYQNKFDYSKAIYINNNTKLKIICPEHGLFEQRPCDHLKGYGCNKCGSMHKGLSKRLTQDIFIKRSSEIHNYKFDYSKVVFETTTSKVVIICPEHGKFLQTPNNHLRGHGCIKCVDRVSHTVGFMREGFINKYKTQATILYIIALRKENESFIKVGITGQSLSSRWVGKNIYKVIPFLQIKNSPDKTWDLEKWLHEKLEGYKYIPQNIFPGHTECFDFRAMMDIQELLLNNPIIKLN